MQENIRKIVDAARQSVETADHLGIREPEPLNQFFQRMGRIAGIYPVPNLAVEICYRSYISETQKLLEKNMSQEKLSQLGQIAYCAVLPRLSDPDSIREFIACVVHGMAIGAIPSTEGTRLLYGAQVAHSGLPSPKRRKKVRKSAQHTPGNQPTTPTPSMT